MTTVLSAQDSQHIQARFAAHIRNPDQQAAVDIAPGLAIESRRLKIYRELIFNNLESFISGTFPIVRSLYKEACWKALIQEFLDHHPCQTPYFLEISQEFLQFLRQRDNSRELPFLEELAHYEWVELALDTLEANEPEVDTNGDLLDALPVMSESAWSLAYRFPVHEIGIDSQPLSVPDEPTYIIVYRDRLLTIQFMLINSATSRLLDLLKEPDIDSGQAAINRLGGEMGLSDASSIQAFAADLLLQLRQANILIGTKR